MVKGVLFMKKIAITHKSLVDPKSGKEIPIISVIPEARDKDFIKIFKLMSMKVLKDLQAGLNGATDTLWWIIDHVMEFKPNEEPIVWIDPQLVAKDLKISPETVKKHVKKLKKFKYIEQIRPRHYNYKLNPNFIYKGSVVQYFEKQISDSTEEKITEASQKKQTNKKTGDTASYSSNPF